jgi:hypothetical protein
MNFDMTKPIPEVQPWSQKFWDGTKEGKLLIQSCGDCGAKIFYPRKYCPECWSGITGWSEASGKGKIYSFSTAYSMVEPRFMDELPYTIAYVDLVEGVRLMTRIVDCDPKEIKIGMEVEVTFFQREDYYMPYFKPAAK